jgi:hypothetical protein
MRLRLFVGKSDGPSVGFIDGDVLGCRVGPCVEENDGWYDGINDGTPLGVNEAVGLFE